ncbi:MAG: sugar nucleotide-binding protein, partial [Lachnospiraceae bacterium]|nr:sugar nucleotide-binding protein [Lachnospiraceae bacterium]
MEYLILGAEGYIGSYLFLRMKTDKLNVVGTGHGNVRYNDLTYYDILIKPNIEIAGLAAKSKKTAIICIGQTNIDLCKMEHELSRKINVTAAKELIRVLANDGYYIIYFSTDNVFDGKKGNYNESDGTCAINEYGKMKEEMEHFLLNEYPDACIFRLPKVLGTNRLEKNMVTDMENKLKGGEVRCIKGTKMSVVSLEDVYQACLIASMRRMGGIYHLSTGEFYSRKEIAEIIRDCLGFRHSRIVELDIESFGFKDRRPLDVGLDSN